MKIIGAIATLAFLWRPTPQPQPQPIIVTILGQHPYILVQVRGWSDFPAAVRICDQEAERRGLFVWGKEVFYPPREPLVNCYLRPRR